MFSSKYEAVDEFRFMHKVCGRGPACKRCKDYRCSTTFIGSYSLFISQRIYCLSKVDDDMPSGKPLAYLYSSDSIVRSVDEVDGVFKDSPGSIRQLIRTPLTLISTMLELRDECLKGIEIPVDNLLSEIRSQDMSDADLDKTRISIKLEESDLLASMNAFRPTKTFKPDIHFKTPILKSIKKEIEFTTNVFLLKSILEHSESKEIKNIRLVPREDIGVITLCTGDYTYFIYDENNNYDSR